MKVLTLKHLLLFWLILASVFAYAKEGDNEDEVNPVDSIRLLYKKAYQTGYKEGFDEANGEAEKKYEVLKKQYQKEIDKKTQILAEQFEKDSKKAEKIQQLIAQIKALRSGGEVEETSESIADLDDLLSKSAAELVAEAIKRFQDSSDEEVEEFLAKKLTGTPLGEFILLNESNLRFVVTLIKDKEAIPKIAGIMDSDSLTYVGINIGVAIIGALISMLYFKKREGKPGIKKLRLIFRLVLVSCYVGLFLGFFGDNVAPALRVFIKAYF